MSFTRRSGADTGAGTHSEWDAAPSSREAFVVFRGTDDAKDMCFNLLVAPTELSHQSVQYHKGFYYSLESDRRFVRALETVATWDGAA